MQNLYLDDALTFTNHSMWATCINAAKKLESNDRAQTNNVKVLGKAIGPHSTPQEADVKVKSPYFEKKRKN